MKAEDIYEAMQSVRPEYLEESEMFKGKRRWPRIILIAAVIALSGIGVTAAVWSLRGAARANMGIEQPIPEWKEYEVPAVDKPVPQGEPLRPDEPDGVQVFDAVTLDSTLCSGDQLSAYLRVRGIEPETGALLEDRTCYWNIGGIRCDWGGSCGNSLGVKHVAYDPDSQTALVRLDVFGLRDVERVYFTLRLDQGLDCLAVYEAVEIPVTLSGDLLSTQIDYTPEQGSYQGEMRAVRAEVFANHIDIDFEITPFVEIKPPVEEDDPYWEYADDEDEVLTFHFIDHMRTLDARAEEALAGATIEYRDGRSEVIAELLSDVRPWRSDSFSGKYENFSTMSRVTFQHRMNQAIDLSQVESVTIGGVTYPLWWKEYGAPVSDEPARNEGPVEKFPETVTLESVECSGGDLTACLRVDGVEPKLGAYLKDYAYHWITAGLENSGREGCGASVTHDSYDEDSQTALVKLEIYGVGDVDRVYFQLALARRGEPVFTFEPVEIPVTHSEKLSGQLDFTLEQGPYYGKVRAVQAEVFERRVCIGFEITPFVELESAKPLSGNQEKPQEYNFYFHEIGDRVEAWLEDATLQFRDGRSEAIAERVLQWSPVSHLISGTNEEQRTLGRLNFRHRLKKPVDLNEVVSITVGGVVYPLN